MGKIKEADLEKIIPTFWSEHFDKTLLKLQVVLEVWDHFRLDIAIIGESGTGKSALLNALLGLRHHDEGLAPVGVVETTMSPTMYQDPKNPHVRLWDLPGMGTPYFMSRNYIDVINYDFYDIFIIVSSGRIKENCMYLVDEIIKSQKPFYFVRSKIDNDLQAESRKHNLGQRNILERIRRDCLDHLQAKTKDPKVFLISTWEPAKFDFGHLNETLEKDLPELKKKAFGLFLATLSKELWGWTLFMKKHFLSHIIQSGKLAEGDLRRLKATFQQSDFSDGALWIMSTLTALDHFELDVAVLADTRSSTTALINALGGISNSNRVQTDISTAEPNEPTSYTHPKYQNVKFWDVMGMKEITDHCFTIEEIDRYDFCIIILSDWSSGYHSWHSRIVTALKKSCYFIHLMADGHFQEETSMRKTSSSGCVGEHCIERQQERNIADLQLSLAFSLEKECLDCADLKRALHRDLPVLHRQAFILHIANIVKQKEKEKACRIL